MIKLTAYNGGGPVWIRPHIIVQLMEDEEYCRVRLSLGTSEWVSVRERAEDIAAMLMALEGEGWKVES